MFFPPKWVNGHFEVQNMSCKQSAGMKIPFQFTNTSTHSMLLTLNRFPNIQWNGASARKLDFDHFLCFFGYFRIRFKLRQFADQEFFCLFLPAASEGWGKVIFSVCLSFHSSKGGTPYSWGGVTPFPCMDGGYPLPWQGVPPPTADQHSVYLLRGGWCASCVHRERLSYHIFEKKC